MALDIRAIDFPIINCLIFGLEEVDDRVTSLFVNEREDVAGTSKREQAGTHIEDIRMYAIKRLDCRPRVLPIEGQPGRFSERAAGTQRVVRFDVGWQIKRVD